MIASASTVFNAVDRSADASRVIEFLLPASRQIAVLYGQRGSRRRELLRDWVLPRLDGIREAYYADCGTQLPKTVTGSHGEFTLEEAINRGAIVFLGRMERFLSTPNAPGRAHLLELLTLAGKDTVPGSLVLVMPEQCLTYVLALQDAAPGLMESMLEIGVVTFRDSLQSLSAGPSGLTYDPEAIDALVKEVDDSGTVDAVELASAVSQGFESFMGGANRRVGLAEYKAIGGVAGALEEFRKLTLDKAVERWGAGADKKIEVILATVVSSLKQSVPLELDDVASRLGVKKEALRDVVGWLCAEGLLSDDGLGRVEVIPTELSAGIEQSAASYQQDVKRARSLLQNGVSSWSQLGALLPQKRLDEIQTIQEWLPATDDEAVLMVRSLLQVVSQEGISSARYWLQRIRSKSGQTLVLIEGLFAESPTVRQGAAELLADFDDRDVLRQLHRVVTEDPDRDVRKVALASLAKMQVEELWPVVSHEARQVESPYQVNAVACLRLFPDERGLALLRELTGASNQPAEVRAEAIETLAAIGSAASVKSLVDISLSDEDVDDQLNATNALAAISSRDRTREAVAAIRDSRVTSESAGSRTLRGAFKHLAAIASSLAVAILNLFAHGAALLVLRRYWLGALFLAFEAIIVLAFRLSEWDTTGAWMALLLLMNWLVSQLVATRVSFVQEKIAISGARPIQPPGKAVRSKLGTSLLAVLLVFDLIPFLIVHGLAQGLAGRPQRAIRLFALQCFGVLCCVVAWYYFTPNFSWITAFPPRISSGLYYIYGGVGLVMFFGTFLWDLGPVIYDLVTDRIGRGGWKRRNALYEAMANNRWVAEYLLECAAQSTGPYRSWARRVVRRTARLMPVDQIILSLKLQKRRPRYLIQGLKSITDGTILKALASELKAATPRLKRWIVDILAGKPSEASLEQLRSERTTLGWYGHLRYGVGLWHYRLRVWPSTVLIISVLLVPLPLLSVYEAAETSRNPGRPVLRMVQAENSRWKQSGNNKLRDAVSDRWRMSDDQLLETLQFLAKVDQMDEPALLSSVFKDSTAQKRDIWSKKLERLATAVCTLPSDIGNQNNPSGQKQQEKVNALRDELVSVLANNLESQDSDSKEALSIIEKDSQHCDISDRSKANLVNAANKVLGDPSSPAELNIAVAALDAAGTPAAVQPLRQIVMQLPTRQDTPGQDTRSRYSGPLLTDDTLRAALSALSSNPSPQADDALDQIKSSQDPHVAKIAGDFIAQRARLRAQQNYERLLAQAEVAYRTAISTEGSVETTTQAINSLNEVKSTGQWSGDQRYMLSTAYALRAQYIARQIKPAGSSVDLRSAMRDALTDAHNAMKEDPSSPLAYSVEASLLQLQHQPQQSLSYLFTAINNQSDYSWAYDLLYDAYTLQAATITDSAHKREKLKEAAAKFTALTDRYPTVIWPQLQLARIYHDNLFDFEHSYGRLKSVEQEFGQQLVGEEKLNLDANLVESCFTAGHYQEAEDLAARLEPELDKDDYDLRIPTSLYLYMALAVQGKTKAADSQLTRLEGLVKELPAGQELQWNYDGTAQFLRSNQMPGEMTAPLADLIDAANKLQTTRKIPPQVIGANRAALKLNRASADRLSH